MATMTAAMLHGVNDLRVEEVPRPEPSEPDTVVVRIKACGFCQTDLKAITGARSNVTFPFLPGHEPSGIVSAVGSAVTRFREGDEVICQPSGSCACGVLERSARAGGENWRISRFSLLCSSLL